MASKNDISAEQISRKVMQDFHLFLKSRQMRRTPEREAILVKALSLPAHFDADDLYMAMEADGYHVSRSTVYNTLDLLCEAAILRSNQFGNGKATYEKITGNHLHLVCTECGKIREVKDEALSQMLKVRRFSSFTPAYFTANIYGLCSTCARKKRKIREAQTKSNDTTRNKS